MDAPMEIEEAILQSFRVTRPVMASTPGAARRFSEKYAVRSVQPQCGAEKRWGGIRAARLNPEPGKITLLRTRETITRDWEGVARGSMLQGCSGF